MKIIVYPGIVDFKLDLPPHPVTVTFFISTFFVGNPYTPSFVTVTGLGGRPKIINPYHQNNSLDGKTI